MVEDTGGKIDLDQLPVGDPTLSAKEIIGNESQERMGLVIGEEHLNTLQKIAERERSPIYTVGDVTDNDRFTFESKTTGNKPMDLALEDMFGSSPKTILTDNTVARNYKNPRYKTKNLESHSLFGGLHSNNTSPTASWGSTAIIRSCSRNNITTIN